MLTLDELDVIRSFVTHPACWVVAGVAFVAWIIFDIRSERRRARTKQIIKSCPNLTQQLLRVPPEGRTLEIEYEGETHRFFVTRHARR